MVLLRSLGRVQDNLAIPHNRLGVVHQLLGCGIGMLLVPQKNAE
jgi:hypothetical protein